MKLKLSLSLSLVCLLILSGCSSDPGLLHQRGKDIWIVTKGNEKLITNGELPQWAWRDRSHFSFFRAGGSCDPDYIVRCGTLYVAEWDHDSQSLIGSPKAITGPDSGTNYAWSRDGQWIVFESFRDKNWEIYKIRFDGTQQTNLTNHPSKDIDPDWSNDNGKNGQIAFVSDRNGDRDIFIMNENGTGLKNLTSHQEDGGNDWGPVWDSDNSAIAFVGTHKFVGNFSPAIFVTYLDSPGSIVVVSDPTKGFYDKPGWSGSEHIFFFDTNPALYAYRYDTKTGERITMNRLPGVSGKQYAVNPRFLYIGTADGLKAIEWNNADKEDPFPVYDKGLGINPN